MKTFLNKLVLLLLTVTTSQYAAAYTVWTCAGQDLKWNTNNVTMRYSSVSFANSAWRGALDTAINNLNQNPSKLRFTKSYNDTNVGISNGQNEAWFTNDDSLSDGAAASWNYDCGSNPVRITEADIVFNVNANFTTSTNVNNLFTFSGSNNNFQATAIHELGHASGLAHTGNTYNVMGDADSHITGNGSNVRAYLGEDAAHGLVRLYGQQSSGHEDLSISRFRYRYAYQGYSLHGPTSVFVHPDNEQVPFNRNDSNGETAPEFDPDLWGRTLQIELTFENNGRTTRTEDVGFYLSTNNIISTGDIRLGGRSLTLGRGWVYTINSVVTLPDNLERNRIYYLGAIIDENNSLSEMTEANNAARMPIWIGPTGY